MKFLLDTNIVYQLYGFHNNKKNAKNFDIQSLYNDIRSRKDEYFISNFNLEEIVTKDRRNDYKQSLINFLGDNNVNIIYINMADIKKFDITNYCNLNNQEFEKLINHFRNNKIYFEIEEFGELLAVIFEYIKIAYGVLMELYFIENGMCSSNLNVIMKNIVDKEKFNIIKKLKHDLKKQILQEYQKEKFKSFLNHVILQMIRSLNCLFINENLFTEQFIKNEQNIQKKFENNVLEYLSNLSRRINKKDNTINLIEHVKIRYCKELENLHYTQPYIKYYGYLITKILSNGNFDKNDFIDSCLFRFVSDDLYLITGETKMQNILAEINTKNYTLLRKYLG